MSEIERDREGRERERRSSERIRERTTQFHAISDEGRKHLYHGGVLELISNNVE